jgi:hypothetical protein
MSKRKAKRYEPKEKTSSFVLRLPDTYDVALKGLVEKGVAKSKNELIVEIVGTFLSEARSRALSNLQKEMEKKKDG